MGQTIVVTGSAGAVARAVVPLLAKRFTLRLSDLNPAGALDGGHEFVRADLRDLDAMRALLRGADGVIHLGAVGKEDAWEPILAVNFDGTYKVFEAARLEGVRRVVYTSSVHAIGFYPRTQRIGVNEYVRPDSRYGLSKSFGESVGSLYADKFGLQVLVVRIGSATPRPVDERRLAIWISARDLTQLFTIGLTHPELRYSIVYGASDNTRSFWDNSSAYALGYRPEDNAETFAPALLANGPVEPTGTVAAACQGGEFCTFD